MTAFSDPAGAASALYNAQKAYRLLRRDHRELLRALRGWWHNDRMAIGFALDPDLAVRLRLPSMNMTMRPIEPRDVPLFTDTSVPGLSGEDLLVRVNARHLIESGIETCYVGVTQDGPVFMEYLITPDQNKKIGPVFDGLFPRLEPGEALLEFAFTLESHRGLIVMPTAYNLLLEIARERGIRSVISFVPIERRTFIGFYSLIGFAPFGIRDERRRFFRRQVSFERRPERELRAALDGLQKKGVFADPRKGPARLRLVNG
jgi:hypothetical protein